MKPKHLEFCGINSFSEPAVIDFEKLLKGGIFGIFGDTGSGKTTILDSIVFALYGRIERARGGSGADIINYNCDRAYVNFEFETESDSGRLVYRIEREIRRKNSLQKAELLRIEGAKTTSIGDGKVSVVNALVQDIVGLSFDDFKKCIALPQGEFAQFVKSEKGERLKLIAHLFGLEEYGDRLRERVNEQYNFYSGEVRHYLGILRGFENVTKEKAETLKNSLAESREKLKILEKEFLQTQGVYNHLQAEYDRCRRAAEVEKQLAVLRQREPEIAEKELAVKRYINVKDAKCFEEESGDLVKKQETEKEKIKKLTMLRDNAASILQEAETLVSKEKYDIRIAELHAQLTLSKYLEQDVALLKIKLEEREMLKSEYKKYAGNSEIAGRELAQCQEELTALAERRKRAEKSGNPDVILRQNLGGALLREEYAESLNYFRSRKSKLYEHFAPEGELFFAVENELTQREARYEELLLKMQDSKTPEEVFQNYKHLRGEFDSILKAEHLLEMKESAARNRKAEAENKLDELCKKGKKLKEETDALQKKISAVTGSNSDFGSFVAKLRAEIESLEEQKQKNIGIIEKCRKEESEASAALKESESDLKFYTENLNIIRQKANAAIEKSGLPDFRAAVEFLQKYPDVSLLEKEIEKYHRDRLSLEGKKAAYTDGASEVREEELFFAREKFENKSVEKQGVISKINLTENDYQEICAKLIEKKALEKDLKDYQHRLNLLEQLRSLLKGNNFMEFVASEYLCDISVAASETLLKLTGGRYFIRYKQGFSVGDNFNGGELRSVATLSGGETFLVSLALALSLSAAIYAKSLRPIEFFFLDEGFGTLDEKLIDTVMDSLEKLKNTHFSIGLISHVEELKHRVDNKITVLGASEGGSSKIQINE